MGLLTINYGQLVQLPKTDKSAVAPFSSAELKLLWDLADTNHEGAMTILILCYTGMRPGELLSSRIEQHLHTEDSHWYLQTGSKTKAGRMRIIPIPTLIRPLILALIGGRTEGPLIAAPQGDHYRLDTWRNRVFKATMEQLHITGRVPYSGRHTYADLQKRRQVSPEVMMRVMGHEDYATTVEHYQTTTEEDISRLCSAVDGMERPS